MHSSGPNFPGFARCWRIPVPRRLSAWGNHCVCGRKGRLSRGGTVERGFRAKIFAQIAERKRRAFIFPSPRSAISSVSVNFPPAFGAATSFREAYAAAAAPTGGAVAKPEGGEVGTAINDALPLKTGHSHGSPAQEMLAWAHGVDSTRVLSLATHRDTKGPSRAPQE